MNWIWQLLMRRRLDRDVSEEVRAHLEERIDQLIHEGLSRQDAVLRARREFGNVTGMMEKGWDVWRWTMVEDFLSDVRFALRQLRKAPIVALAGVLTLALGIGANTALFSVVNTLLFKSLPYHDAERLVYVTEFWPREPIVPGPPSPDFANWRANSKLIDGIAAYGGGADALNLIGAGEPERIRGTMVTASLLELIGARMALGRNFTAEEDPEGGPPVAILGYGLWQRKFGASPDAIGKVIRLNGVGRTIVGVLPSGFAFPDNNFGHELLVPMSLPAEVLWRDGRSFRLLRVIARVKPGVTPSALKEEFASLVRATASLEPPQMVIMRKDMEVRVTPLRDWLTGGVRRMVLMLQITVAMLLLIACLNIASLQIARAVSRQKEMAVRAAVGAGRGRLIRQLLTESFLLSGFGGGLGLVLGRLSLAPLRTYFPASLHMADTIRVDAAVMWFTCAVVVLTTTLAGMAPALLASRPQLQQTIREGVARSRRHQRLQGVLVTAEVAVATVLLVGSALFVRTFMRLSAADPGFRPEGVLTMRLSLPQTAYPDSDRQLAFFTELLGRVRAIPGVESAAISGGLPLIGTRSGAGISIEGQPPVPLGARPTSPTAGATQEYFRTLGIPILRGRAFLDADENGPRVVIVNQAFAERYFPGEDALGKRIEVASRQRFWREIVGIAGNVKQQGRRPVDPFVIYSPMRQLVEAEVWLVLKSSTVPPAQLIRAATAAVHSVDRNQPVYDVATMEQRLGIALSAQRANMTLMSFFAVLALVLSAIGIFGVIAQFVNRRVHEIGIRMALGATGGEVLSLVLCRGMLLAGGGIAIGLAGSLLLTRSVRAVLEDIQPNDPWAFSAAAAVFALTAAAACLLPARKASRVDPMVTLRHD